jgi:hypothetical protein
MEQKTKSWVGATVQMNHDEVSYNGVYRWKKGDVAQVIEERTNPKNSYSSKDNECELCMVKFNEAPSRFTDGKPNYFALCFSHQFTSIYQ